MTSSLPAGLRERKKARTRAAIRGAAMRLFDTQGYAATTVDQIAEAAEVSQSTFFRYFPTKEDVVLTDEYDPAIVAAMRAQPAGMHPVDVFLAAVLEVYGNLGPAEVEAEMQRQRLFLEVPELRARMMHQTVTSIDMLAEVIAERAGRQSGDVQSKVLAGAIVGAVLAVAPMGRDYDFGPRNLGDMRMALTQLRAGFPDLAP